MGQARKIPVKSAAEDGGLDASLREILGYTVKRTSNILQADAAAVLDPLGLRITTFSALVVICDHPDVTQSQIAAALNMERSNTVLIIDALEEAELIGRHRVPTDRRAYALRATLEGMKTRDAAVRALSDREEILLQDLSREERATLMALLGRIKPQP
ncbi:transcriptional regulator SlyA [Thalassovita gelatinovora]|uniref:Transcriptional regulator SlyA n=1 Tax=Thalassovita gelatinovora TaxID=53501 RepID=A0A0P1FE74_THAGE|nr:MarR family transcriptional regulator [Thalassovita gelatinovora]QIZ81490.1 MarR family transcriptional regulator [Thalassovita gelatinovora]CUH66337.1 transcriptional regulator SlyA [Thalassovita gelatinovora]SEQ24071.1 DNA-binding transcriptional regulator, MarR family [Thalassovita gelatinovora]